MKIIKKNLPIIISIILFILLVGIFYYFAFEKDYTYYSKIDNNRIKKVESSGGVFDLHGGMDYEYNLRMYDELGNSKEIKFGTDRELKQDAYIKVKYYIISGVNKWEEVMFDELPERVKKHYQEKS